MYAQKTHHVDHEILKWLVLIVLTLLLVLFTTRSSGAEVIATTPATRAKGTIAPLIGKWIQTHPTPTIELPAGSRLGLHTPTARRLWAIFGLHEESELKQAIAHWQQLSLFDSDEPWRAIAVGQAYLQLGDLDDALCVRYDGSSPANAVTHQLRGVTQYLNSRVAVRKGQLYLAEELRECGTKEIKKRLRYRRS